MVVRRISNHRCVVCTGGLSYFKVLRHIRAEHTNIATCSATASYSNIIFEKSSGDLHEFCENHGEHDHEQGERELQAIEARAGPGKQMNATKVRVIMARHEGIPTKGCFWHRANTQRTRSRKQACPIAHPQPPGEKRGGKKRHNKITPNSPRRYHFYILLN